MNAVASTTCPSSRTPGATPATTVAANDELAMLMSSLHTMMETMSRRGRASMATRRCEVRSVRVAIASRCTRDSENSAVSEPAKNADANNSAKIASNRSNKKEAMGAPYFAGPGASGIVKEKIEPLPVSESTHTAPPCASTRRLTIDKPEARAAVLARRAVVDLEEGIEHALGVLGRHADARVAHRDAHRAAATRPPAAASSTPPTPRPCRPRA